MSSLNLPGQNCRELSRGAFWSSLYSLENRLEVDYNVCLRVASHVPWFGMWTDHILVAFRSWAGCLNHVELSSALSPLLPAPVTSWKDNTLGTRGALYLHPHQPAVLGCNHMLVMKNKNSKHSILKPFLERKQRSWWTEKYWNMITGSGYRALDISLEI